MYIRKTSSVLVLVDADMRIVPEVLDFTRYLERKEFSPNTINTYLEKLCVFYKWMEKEELRPFEVEPRHMPRFIDYIDNAYAERYQDKTKVSPSTLNGYLAALGTFYKYFGMMGFVEPATYKIEDKRKVKHLSYLRHVNKKWDASAFSYFSRKKRKGVDKKRLFPEEAELFYKAIGEISSKDESLKVRNELIYKLLYETGMRIGELLHLRISDYDLPEPFQKVGNIYLVDRGNLDDEDRQLKTGERTIPISTELLQEIDDYVMYYRPQVGNCDYLFVNHIRNIGLPPSKGTIEEIFRKANEVSELKRKYVTPHSLRHTHASNMTDMGIDIAVVQARLGHSGISTTLKYTHVSIETLSLSYENYLTNKKGLVF